jgi:hypothetical protein
MKWKKRIAVALLALTIASPVEAQRQAVKTCPRVITSGYVMDGAYAGVNCPRAHLLVVMEPDQPLPRRGPARLAGGVLYAGGYEYAVLP